MIDYFWGRNLKKVEKMKGLIKVVGAAIVMLMLTSCIIHEHHGRRVPPGHAKRIYIYEKGGHGNGHYKNRGNGHRHH